MEQPSLIPEKGMYVLFVTADLLFCQEKLKEKQ